ncbi:hypothetical protein VB618_00750 [Microvirga sp. CF3062]|uniref:hypothetical protein n=1 Tax=Microvirga sp. CF3062 TaxID=3110182 RepID=UPI002E776807|nr:hypothetical protein [Microvirga sp. CF3062]MEE1654709.1 hypothetical protein [Microvirga sp. CF3062]
MKIDDKSSAPWSTRSFALNGALLGLIVGVVHGYVHAFWSPSSGDDVLPHLIAQMAKFIFAGAFGLAALSVIRNWLVRRR